MTLSTDVKTVETRVVTFLSVHHIVLYLALAAALGFGIYSIESKVAELAQAKADAATVALAVERDHSAQMLAAFNTAEAQREADRAALDAANAKLQSQTKIQIVHDQALPAPDLGHRIETITGFKQGTITLNSTDDLIVPLPLGRQIVAQLDQGAADAAIVTNQAGIIKSQVDTIDGQAGTIAEDKKVLQAQIDTDGKVLKAEKASARKGKLKWFGIGFIAGFVTREVIKP